MGQLLSYLSNDKTKSVDVFLDFENATPSESEAPVFTSVGEVLSKGPALLSELKLYPGCEELIRKAITHPGEENEKNAWEAVLPAVEKLKTFYDFSLEIETVFPKLLAALCTADPKSQLGNQQALAKQMADVFDFVLRFDDAKMINPAIQNDFSYYRRTLNRMKQNKVEVNVSIKDELANKMSLFFAYPTPMMNVINTTTISYLSSDQSVSRENVATGLALMANVCQYMVEAKKYDSEKTNMFCLRAMTGCIILYDHLHPHGAFHRKSPIAIRDCITTTKNFVVQDKELGSVAGLLNALRFTTIHLNDPETPAVIKHLLE